MTKQSFFEQVPTYVSLFAVAAFFAATWNLNRMRNHALILWFLAVQLLCGIVMLAALIAGVKRDSKTYLILFFVSLLITSIPAWILSLRWMLELPAAKPIELALTLAVVGTVGLFAYLHDRAPNSGAFLFYASVFAFPGALSLLTTASALNRVETMVHLGLSLFWLLMGLYAYSLAAGYANENLRWLEAAWVPAGIAILCFGLTAVGLGKAQFETARQSVNADVAIQESAR